MSIQAENGSRHRTFRHGSRDPNDPPQMRKLSLMRSGSKLHRTKSQKLKLANARIGIWVDGVAHWDSAASAHLSMIAEESTSGTPPCSHTVGTTNCFQYALSPQFAEGDVARSDLVTPISTDQYSSEAGDIRTMVSPLSASVLELPSVESIPFDTGATSEPSSDSEHDDSSIHDRNSSATSVEMAEILVELSPELIPNSPLASVLASADINKPLPPVPPYETLVKPACNQRRSSIPLSPREHIITQSRIFSTKLSPPVRLDHSSALGPSYDQLSPTLSEAEEQLKMTLDSVELSCQRSSSVRSILSPPSRAPTIPRRSRRREYRGSMDGPSTGLGPPTILQRRHSQKGTSRMENEATFHGVIRSPTCHSRSTSAGNAQNDLGVSGLGFTNDLDAEYTLALERRNLASNHTRADSGTDLCKVNPELEAYLNLPSLDEATQQQDVLMAILSSLQSTQDLFSMALINKGMFRVYQENELDLISAVLSNESPPAAEFRQWCNVDREDGKSPTDDSSSFLGVSPLAYMRGYRRDCAVLDSLKALIRDRCETVLRRETFDSLCSTSHPNSQRVTDAFWRIWCFCEIFGCGKGREDDLLGQLDWLKGGQLAKSGQCEATVQLDVEFDANSVLLNPAEHFAIGNKNGLDADELFDMLEIWKCLTSLLNGYHGRVEQARQYGVFQRLSLMSGSEQDEATTLEEWTSYLVTLGPAVILDLALRADDPSDAGFLLAQENGWTGWTHPEYTNSRNTFLQDSVIRLYRELISDARRRSIGQSLSHRTSHLAMEIRLGRQQSASTITQTPDPRTFLQRPSSIFSAFSFATNASRDYYRPVSDGEDAAVMEPSTNLAVTPLPVIHLSPDYVPRSHPRACAQPAAQANPAASSRVRPQRPRIDTSFGGVDRTALQFFGRGTADDTSNRAVRQMVDMGFLPTEARDALRITDPGDGLRLDRAVEYLLQKRASASRR